MIVLVVLLIMCFVFFLVWEIATISVSGFPPKDKDVLEFLEKIKEKNLYVMDGVKPNGIIGGIGDGIYISTALSSCLMGGYINDVGAIPRWYKSYGEIKKLYVKLGPQKIVNTKTKREKLGL